MLWFEFAVPRPGKCPAHSSIFSKALRGDFYTEVTAFPLYPIVHKGPDAQDPPFPKSKYSDVLSSLPLPA